MDISPSELEFLLSHIKGSHNVLEYGSGSSTKIIAERAGLLTSVEHNEGWYNRVLTHIEKRTTLKNINLIFAKPDFPWVAGTDGTFDQFKTYVESPLGHGPFDVIVIDGRARVGCASVCRLLGHGKTNVFIHDYTRQDGRDYTGALDYLEQIDRHGTLFRFKIK